MTPLAPPTSPSPFLSVVIPAYNEQDNLPTTVATLIEKLSASVPSFELLIVDDASRDATGAIADGLAERDARVRAFHHPHNRGIGGGFVTGAQNACGEWFMLIPADLALDPDELHKYFDAARDADVVVGLRSNKNDYTMLRRFISWTNIRLIQVLFGMPQRQFQYISLYRTRLFHEIEIEYSGSAFFWGEILVKARARGYRMTQVEISYLPRQSGHATGGNPRLVARTVRDMFDYWLRGDWRRLTTQPPNHLTTR